MTQLKGEYGCVYVCMCVCVCVCVYVQGRVCCACTLPLCLCVCVFVCVCVSALCKAGTRKDIREEDRRRGEGVIFGTV